MVSLLTTRMRVPTTTMNSAAALVANTGCLPQSLHQIVGLGPKRLCPAAVLMLPRNSRDRPQHIVDIDTPYVVFVLDQTHSNAHH
jgi:hypothetical protein